MPSSHFSLRRHTPSKPKVCKTPPKPPPLIPPPPPPPWPPPKLKITFTIKDPNRTISRTFTIQKQSNKSPYDYYGYCTDGRAFANAQITDLNGTARLNPYETSYYDDYGYYDFYNGSLTDTPKTFFDIKISVWGWHTPPQATCEATYTYSPSELI